MTALGDFARRRRRWLLAIAAVCLMALGIGVAAAWHYSSTVLVPDHSNWPEDVTVEALTRDRVVLSRDEDTERPGVYGIEWQGGHAVVGAISKLGEDTVSRRLRDVRGYLVPEMKVAVDADVYSGDPAQALGLRFADVRYRDELGPMPAWLIPGRSRTWAIVVHGINGSRENGLRIAPALHRAGLPALLISYREDQGAPPSPDGFHHMGLTEWLDLQAAARYALAHGARRLVLVGASMGGAIVAQFMERSPLAQRVAGLVLDAPALNWKAVLSFNATREGFPSIAATPLEWAIGARIDVDWDSLDALTHTEDLHVPILLFHGTDDKVVPISTSADLAEALPRWVTFYKAPHAGHVESWNVAPGLYERRLVGFIAGIR